MKPINVKVIGTGSYVPEKVLTNEDLEKMVDTSDEWITTRTGIKTRRIAAEDEATSDMAYKAACKALDDAGLGPKDIDLIIVATITPDMFFPSTACWVQEKLKAENATAFDLSAACSGYIFSYAIASGFLYSGTYKNALVIGAEKLTSILDWEDRGTCVIFGDGAGAAVLTISSGDSQLLAYDLGSNGAYGDLLYIPGGGSKNPATEETV
ncbi:MAG: 3-oxoacyl-ACP synthase, partial [Thermoplasmata archaeon]